MPIYEFYCDDCDRIQDVPLSMEAPKVDIACEKCGAAMWRKWTATPAHFKGDGWGGSKR